MFISTSNNLINRVPIKLTSLETELFQKSYSNEINLENCRVFFVDSFRKMINFKIPPLNPNDKEYEEFKNDTKIPLISAAKNLEQLINFNWTIYPGALILLNRLFKKNQYEININNMHRIFFISILISDKYIEDTPSENSLFGMTFGFKDVFIFFFSNNLGINFINRIRIFKMY